MGLTDPLASRHSAADGCARRYAADVATRNVAHCTLYHRRRGKHPTGIAVQLIRHLRTDRMPEEVRALEALKRWVDERPEAGLAGGAVPAAVAEV